MWIQFRAFNTSVVNWDLLSPAAFTAREVVPAWCSSVGYQVCRLGRYVDPQSPVSKKPLLGIAGQLSSSLLVVVLSYLKSWKIREQRVNLTIPVCWETTVWIGTYAQTFRTNLPSTCSGQSTFVPLYKCTRRHIP